MDPTTHEVYIHWPQISAALFLPSFRLLLSVSHCQQPLAVSCLCLFLESTAQAGGCGQLSTEAGSTHPVLALQYQTDNPRRSFTFPGG